MVRAAPSLIQAETRGIDLRTVVRHDPALDGAGRDVRSTCTRGRRTGFRLRLPWVPGARRALRRVKVFLEQHPAARPGT